MSGAYGSIFTKLANRQVVTPYLETAIMSESWPENYTVTVDTAPYYGSFPIDGDLSVFKESRTGSGDGRFHPSTHALMDETELYYHFHPEHQHKLVADKWSYQSIMGVTMGTALHAIYQTQLKMCGLLEEQNEEVEYVDDELGGRGRLDAVLTNHPTEGVLPLEIKSITHRMFDRQMKAGIKPGWDAQFSICLDQLGYDRGVILMAEMGQPFRTHEFEVRKNQQLLDETYAKWARVREAIKRDTPPGPCCGKTKTCPAKDICGGLWG